MEGNDLVVGRNQGIVLMVDSLEAKTNLMNIVRPKIKDKDYTCGECAAYPCFKNRGEDFSAKSKLCFQKERRCRDECDDFFYNEDSGITPRFQITGTCNKGNMIVNYEERCRYLD